VVAGNGTTILLFFQGKLSTCRAWFVPDPSKFVQFCLPNQNRSKHVFLHDSYQCFGSVCFWASRIRIRILPFSHKLLSGLKYWLQNKILIQKFNFNHQTYFYNFWSFLVAFIKTLKIWKKRNFSKGLVASATLFVYFIDFFVQYIHSYIHSPRVHSCIFFCILKLKVTEDFGYGSASGSVSQRYYPKGPRIWIRVRNRTNMSRIPNTDSYVHMSNSKVFSFVPVKIWTGLHSLSSEILNIVVFYIKYRLIKV
jgi:hypothetical protein